MVLSDYAARVDHQSIMGRIFSIGHSNHDAETFVGLLQKHQVEVVVDLRSYPVSNYTPHFNKENLVGLLKEAGIQYMFMGRELGGRPTEKSMYDEEGHVRYDLVADSEIFREGIARLEDGLTNMRVAMVCAEEDPTNCHRRLLVGRVLGADGIAVDHIRKSGGVEPEELIAERERAAADNQLDLFQGEQEVVWRSTQSVLPSEQRRASSRP